MSCLICCFIFAVSYVLLLFIIDGFSVVIVSEWLLYWCIAVFFMWCGLIGCEIIFSNLFLPSYFVLSRFYVAGRPQDLRGNE